MNNVLKKIRYKSLYVYGYSRARITMLGVVLKEIRVSVPQFYTWYNPFFSIYRIITVFNSSILRLILGRSVKYSFAFTGEDRIIESILKPRIQDNGFYVDVGCNHPIHISNTYGLYRKGWKGICVDANERLIKKYRYLRPKDKAIHCLVSDKESSRSFFIAENDGLSTTEKANLHEIEQQGIEFKETSMQSRTLTSILIEQNAPKTFDLLSIDVEEHDLQVLKSLDFNLYSPRLIVLEDETFDPCQPLDNDAYSLLTNKGYNLEGYILKNLYFLRKR